MLKAIVRRSVFYKEGGSVEFRKGDSICVEVPAEYRKDGLFVFMIEGSMQRLGNPQQIELWQALKEALKEHGNYAPRYQILIPIKSEKKVAS